MRVNPERARRYRDRTVTPPPATYVMSAQEREQHEEWMRAFERGLDDVPAPPVVDWHGSVRAYCKAKGLGRPEITVEENRLDMTHTLRWTTKGDA